MDDALRSWVEDTIGGRIVGAARPPVGGSRELYLVDVEQRDGTVLPLVVRCEGGGSFAGTEVSPSKEAVVYRALEDTPVPVPRVLALAADGATLVMERVPGTDDLSGLDADARRAIMQSFIDGLVALHTLDVEDLSLPGFARPASAEEHARLDLEMWARLANDGVEILDPLARYAGAWLWAQAPTSVARTVLVQGDTGPGNFVFDRETVTGIVDWEFAHLGDPMDDWAWLDMRAMPDELPALQERYANLTGITIDRARIAYYRIAVDYRCAITTSLAVSRGGGARGWAPYLLVTQRYLDGIATRLSARLGIEEHAEVPQPTATPRARQYDALITGIRTAVRHLDDADVREETRNLQILVRYLRAYDELGLEIEDLDRVDRVASLGAESLDDAEFVRLVEHGGAHADERTWRYLLRRHARTRVLWASLLDRSAR
jgi:aminoglycoside phosphotransferase (APT) family kinase protein